MIIFVFILVVLAQIVLFHFVAGWANRSILLEESERLKAPIPETVSCHAARAPIIRMGIGGVLASILLLAPFLLSDDPEVVKILIAGVSIVSAIAFLAGQSTDRKIMRDLADASPDGNVRRASLAPRDLGRWHHPALEAIPLVIFIATIAFLTIANASTTGSERTRALVFLSLQGAVVVGGLYRSVRPAAGAPSVAQFLPSLRRHPEVSIRLCEELAITQLRFNLVAKIGITSLLGTAVVKTVLRAAGHPASSSWGIIGWCIVVVLILAYAIYLRQVGRISRTMQEQMS